MEKIFKKSLALMVSAALCLTAFVGCLTVNAEATATPTYTITAQNGKAGDTVTVNVDGTNLTSVCGQQVYINIPAALTIASVKDNKGNAYKNVANVAEGDAFDYSVVTTETTKQVRFADIINFPATGSDGAIATAEFHIVFELTIPDTAAVGAKYDIAFDTATMFADINENAIGITVESKTITVQAAQPACEHVWEFVSAIPAVENGENGTISFKCSACGETKNVTDVTYLKKSSLATPDIGCTATTQLILKTSVSNYSGATAGYVTVTHHYGTTGDKSVEVLDIKDAETVGNYYQWIVGVKSIHFSDTFTTVFYTERDGAWVSGLVRDFSIKSAAMSTVKSTTATTAIKKVAANLLRMGAEAQKAFSYDTDNLADSELVGDYEQYVTTTTPSVVKDTATNFVRDNTGVSTGEKLGFAVPSISLSDSISFNFIIATKSYSDLSSLDDLKMVVNYTSFNGGEFSQTITEYTTNASGQFVFVVDVIAPNMRVPVTIQLFNGDTAVSNTATFSVEGVLAHALISNSSYTDVVNAIMNYSDSAKEAF